MHYLSQHRNKNLMGQYAKDCTVDLRKRGNCSFSQDGSRHEVEVYRTADIAARNRRSKSSAAAGSLAADSTAFWAMGRGYPRLTSAESTSSATAPREGAAGCAGEVPVMSSSLSLSSSTTRSAVFLPMPGILVKVAWSPARIAPTNRSAERPLSTVIASLGPMPEMVRSF